MSLHKEWATFIDPRDASTWQIDLTFLSSAWKCIFGCGCKGIHGEPVMGCCSSGVFIQASADDEEGAEDFDLVKKRVKQLTDEDWDLRPQFNKNWWRERGKGSGSKHTKLHDGGCVFANRGDGPSGSIGCAFHVAALRRGEDPIDWKPWTCGLVPFAIDHSADDEHHTLRAYEHERDWGSGESEPLDWWCVDSPDAYVGAQPVYRSEESLLRRILGDELYEEVVVYMDARYAKPGTTPINWVGHWGVEPPDGSTAIPLPMAPQGTNGRAKP
ncbi:MAG TPA: hypothetical protein VH300_19665 [Thermoleophilaceae bacterium]|jgi:hypothetical protein|nr:hypothetical protein [Thermoleophilaceae bacterium]